MEWESNSSMRFLEQVAQWLGISADGESSTQRGALQAAMEKGRRFKRAGRYDEALEAFEHARELVGGNRRSLNQHLLAMIGLHRADILIRQGRWAEAEELLGQLEQDATANDRKPQRAYVTTAMGTLAQEQGDWEKAREHYDRSLELARDAKALGAEGRAQGHLADMYLHEGNASFAVYLLEEALPKLDMSGDLELSSYFMGRLGEAMIEMGREHEGRERMGRALRLAERMRDRPSERHWREALAVQAVMVGNYPEARRQFMLVLAQLDEDARYARILCRLSKVCLRLGEQDAALDYARQATELCERLDITDDVNLMARASLGAALRTAGEFGAAIEHLNTAAGDYEQVAATEADYSYVEVLRNLAAAQAETADYATAIETYERALEYAEQYDSPLDTAGTRRDLGILYARRGDPQAAIQAWTTALQIYEREREHARVARLHCDIGNLRRQMGQTARAMKDYEQALMLLSSIDDLETRGVVLSNAATTYVDQGDIETAESFFVESIKIAQRLNDRHAEATRRGNYGWFLVTTGRAKRALVALTYALRQSENLELTLQAAVQTDNIGLAHDEMGEYAKALEHHRRALEMLEGIDAGAGYWKGIVKANLGCTLTVLDEAEEGAVLLKDALATGREQDNVEIIVRALSGLGKAALRRGDLETAGEMTEEAAILAERAGMRRLLADALILRSEALARAGHTEDADAAWNHASKLLNMLQIPPEERAPDWVAAVEDKPSSGLSE